MTQRTCDLCPRPAGHWILDTDTSELVSLELKVARHVVLRAGERFLEEGVSSADTAATARILDQEIVTALEMMREIYQAQAKEKAPAEPGPQESWN